MFSQRFVAWFLLTVYGLPAACGPYWHRHHHSEAHIQFTQGITPEAACGCCAHICEPIVPLPAASGVVSDSPECEHDACAICRYYATAAALTHFALCLAPQATIDATGIAQESNPISAVLAAQPRGPPQL